MFSAGLVAADDAADLGCVLDVAGLGDLRDGMVPERGAAGRRRQEVGRRVQPQRVGAEVMVAVDEAFLGGAHVVVIVVVVAVAVDVDGLADGRDGVGRGGHDVGVSPHGAGCRNKGHRSVLGYDLTFDLKRSRRNSKQANVLKVVAAVVDLEYVVGCSSLTYASSRHGFDPGRSGWGVRAGVKHRSKKVQRYGATRKDDLALLQQILNAVVQAEGGGGGGCVCGCGGRRTGRRWR